MIVIRCHVIIALGSRALWIFLRDAASGVKSSQMRENDRRRRGSARRTGNGRRRLAEVGGGDADVLDDFLTGP